MRLPWVSRLAYDQMEAAWLHEIDNRANTQTRHDRLLTMYHELALRVTEPPKQTVDVKPASTAEDAARLEDIARSAAMPLVPVSDSRVRSVIAQTIKDEAAGNPKIAQWLHKRARELRAENKTPEEIAAALRQWQTTEEADEEVTV